MPDLLKSLIDKVSNYNLYNYLLPGLLFTWVIQNIINVSLPFVLPSFEGFVFAYASGLIISRIGSLIIEPLLKKTKVVSFSEYSKYVEASKIDASISLFSEVCNTYRTLSSLSLVLLAVFAIKKVVIKFQLSNELVLSVILFALLLLFVISYRKQVRYLASRIDANLKKVQNG